MASNNSHARLLSDDRHGADPANPQDEIDHALELGTIYKFEMPLLSRLLMFSVIVVLMSTSQLLGLSSLLNGSTGERDPLKQRLAYWATACVVLNSLMLFCLARWFTKDLAWHVDSRNFRHIWGMSPALSSLLVVLRVKSAPFILLGFSLAFISLVSFVLGLWLMSAIEIAPYSYTPTIGTVTLMDMPYGNADNDVSFMVEGGRIYHSFVQQGSVSNLGKIPLSPYQDQFLWSPFLVTSAPSTVYVENVNGIAFKPSCVQLNATALNLAPRISSTNNPVNFTVAGQKVSVPGLRGRDQFWTFLTTSDWPHPTVHNIMTSQTGLLGMPSFYIDDMQFTDNQSQNLTRASWVYVASCNFTQRDVNVTGYINSYKPDRLTVVSMTDLGTKNMSGTIAAILEGLDAWTKSPIATAFDDVYLGLPSQMWMWMHGQEYNKPKIETLNTTINSWTETKLTELVSATLTTSTVAIFPRNVTGATLVDTSIMIATPWRILVGLMLQLTFVVVAVAIYLSSRASSTLRSDDITLLLPKDAMPLK
ncbi:hypothetical protein BGX28_004304 [Mortierella sp. GBA30]|nr:hypothetical protein BGX28_004304 [Mortierella sp. GBA30]